MATGTSCMESATTTTSEATQPDSARQAAFYCLLAAAVSGGLLWACFQPLALGTYLGWIALVPFLVLVRSKARPTYLYFCAVVCGVVFFVPALSWMRVAHSAMIAAWLALGVYCALYFPVALLMIRRLERWRLPMIVSVPMVWIAMEYVRCFFLTGFPWYLLAHTQHDLLPMIQITDIGGVFLVTLIVAAVNGFLFDCAYQFPEVRRWFNQSDLEPYRFYSSVDLFNRGGLTECLFRRNLILEGIGMTALLVGAFLYGQYRLGQDRFQAGPTVCLLQSNIDQRIRDGAALEEIGERKETVAQHFTNLCVRASFNHAPKPDLLIWPETSYPLPWIEVSTKLPITEVPVEWRDHEIDIRDKLRALASEQTHVAHLLGMNAYFLDEHGKPRHYNSALHLSPEGHVEARFDKVHRVVFGEYIPLKDWLPFLKVLSPYPEGFDVQQGEKLTRFKINRHHFGVLVCFEDTDPSLARRYVEATDDGPGVDFLVNISNDGWFGGSSEHEEHLAVSRFRAIECRRAMVRSVNMGVSAVIDGNGRVLKPTLAPGTDPPVWMVQEKLMHFEELPSSRRRCRSTIASASTRRPAIGFPLAAGRCSWAGRAGRIIGADLPRR